MSRVILLFALLSSYLPITSHAQNNQDFVGTGTSGVHWGVMRAWPGVWESTHSEGSLSH